MLKVDKTPEPEFFKEFKRKNRDRIKNWDDMNAYSDVKQDLREYMLLEEQDCRCPYCETAVDDESEGSIEHIRPKDKFKDLFMEYDNFITSCKSSYSCDNFKGNDWDDRFIDPTKENPEEYFSYDLFTGEIIPKEESGKKYDRAKVTIEILNLNHSKLKRARGAYLKSLLRASEEDLVYYKEYPSLVKYYKEIQNLS